MMKYLNIIATVLVIALCLISCELKNELTGKYDLKADEGLLTLDLVTKAPNSAVTREGEIMDVDAFKVEIINEATDAVVRTYPSFAELKKALPIILPAGDYKIIAKSGELQDASRDPYFEGNSSIKVEQGLESKAEVMCKLATVVVNLNLSDEFLNLFEDDYTISVSNGKGGVLYFTKEELNSIYLSIPEGAVAIKVVAKVTQKETGRDIETAYTVSKPDKEVLQGGDAFNVKVGPSAEGEEPDTDISGTPSNSQLGIKLDVDFTMIETGVTIKVPTELIEESKPDDPNQPEPTEDEPEIIGADEIIDVDTSNPPVVQVTLKAPAGIKNLFVTIVSESTEFMSIIAGLGLNETFDLANPGDLEDKLGGSLEDGSGIGLIDPSDPVKNKKEFLFDVTDFMPLLAVFKEEGKIAKHQFVLRLVDNNNKEVSKTLNVQVIK